MPPRFSYWTIIAGGLPTAFRAAEREELLPTFTRLKEKQPDAEMKWFARGKLWASPEEAREHAERRRAAADGRTRRDDRPRGSDSSQREARGRDWRPGGEHRDPRQQFKDAKKERNQRLKAEKFDRRSRRDEAPRERPHGDPLAPRPRTGHPDSRPGASFQGRRPPGRDDRAGNDRGAKHESNRSSPPRENWTDRGPRTKPHGDKLTRPPYKRNRDDGDQSFKPREGSSFRPRDRDKPAFKPREGSSFRPRDRDKPSFKPREGSSFRP